MRRSRSRRAPSRGRARVKEWVGFNTQSLDGTNQATQIALNSSTVYANYVLSPDSVTSLFDEPTLLRSLLAYSWTVQSTFAANTSVFFALGIIRSTIEAPDGVLPGALSPYVPIPFFDSDSEWIWETHYTVSAGTNLVPGGQNAFLNHVGREDVRAKRKFNGGQGLLLVAWCQTLSGAGGINLTLSGRLLFQNS